MKLRFPDLLCVPFCFVLSVSAGNAQDRAAPARVAQIKVTVEKVRSGKTVEARAEAAEHLANLTQNISNRQVTEAIVTDMASLLDSRDDSVRYWVATALGNIGPAAESAIPKLEKLLPVADCTSGAITSASGIRYALNKMGVKTPPPPKCDRVAG
jgi:hypothetical protein